VATNNVRYSRFERARIVGSRALQIAMGAPVLLEIDFEALNNPVEIAIREFEAGVIPITVKRSPPPKQVVGSRVFARKEAK
jgi:DNA-directed RNA polymerase subunit K